MPQSHCHYERKANFFSQEYPSYRKKSAIFRTTMTLYVCTLGGRGWMVVRARKRKEKSKKSESSSNDDPIRMHPGWAGVDGGTCTRKEKSKKSESCHKAIASRYLK